MAFIWIVVLMALCIPLLGLVVDGPIGRALASRLERPKALPGDGSSATRIEQLEREVDTLRRELGELREAQEFLQALLGSSRPATRLPPPGE